MVGGLCLQRPPGFTQPFVRVFEPEVLVSWVVKNKKRVGRVPLCTLVVALSLVTALEGHWNE